MQASNHPEFLNEKQLELQRIRDAIQSGLIQDVDDLGEEEYELLLELHPSRDELEALFDELRGPAIDG